jgi:hypothetical protein
MLRVEEGLQALFFKILDGFSAQGEVRVEGAAQDLADVQVPSLAHDGRRRGARGHDGIERDIVRDATIGPSGAAEGDHLGVLETLAGNLFEELHLFRIRRRVASFDVVHAQLVQPSGDCELVLQGEADPFGLHSVA